MFEVLRNLYGFRGFEFEAIISTQEAGSFTKDKHFIQFQNG